ncbi:MAG: FlgO family outer membrane protein [Rheinheimera sp.]|nr:FlgO family outer membrane protein [Rheinheimera sp.]
MKKIHSLLLLCLAVLSGCASWERYSLLTGGDNAGSEVALQGPAKQSSKPQYYVSPALYDGEAYQATQQAVQKLQPQYQPQAAVNVNHFVQSMMHDLVANLDLVNPQMVIGMTSFVYLDGPYDQTDLLGNQLSESFMHEVHQFGLGVIDFKTTDYIRVTPQGDFVFSRDFMDLKEEQPIEYVLGGTLVRHQGGTLINARLVSVASKKVAATAQGFIPQHVVDALYHSGGSEKLLLKQGE